MAQTINESGSVFDMESFIYWPGSSSKPRRTMIYDVLKLHLHILHSALKFARPAKTFPEVASQSFPVSSPPWLVNRFNDSHCGLIKFATLFARTFLNSAEHFSHHNQFAANSSAINLIICLRWTMQMLCLFICRKSQFAEWLPFHGIINNIFCHSPTPVERRPPPAARQMEQSMQKRVHLIAFSVYWL